MAIQVITIRETELHATIKLIIVITIITKTSVGCCAVQLYKDIQKLL